MSVTIASFIISPLIVPIAPSLANRLAKLFRWAAVDRNDLSAASYATDVIVIGFGPSGQLATVPLIPSDLNVTVIDLNQVGIRKAKEFGFDGQIGDATSAEVLEHASVGEANLVIITLPHFRSTLEIAQLVRSMNPSATLLVRSRYHIHSDALAAVGAIVSGDEDEVGAAISGHVTKWLAETAPTKTKESPSG